MSQMAKFDQAVLHRGLSKPVRVGDDYVDLAGILGGFDPAACGLDDGLVFLFEDDGRPNLDFFRWVSGMSARGKRSVEGRRGYAYDVAGWFDFLDDAYGTDYLNAEFEDLDEYGRELRTASENPVSGQTWNRKLAAIRDFYRSLARGGRLSSGDGPFGEPDAYRELRSRAVGARAVRYLLLPQLRYFIQVGVRGYRPDGTIDTAFRGGYPGRDACMAKVLATTGMRRNEMRSLTTVEADLEGPIRQGRRLTIGAPAKGGRPGDVIVPRRTLEELRAYVEGDRDVIVSVANSTGSLTRHEPTMIVVEEIDQRRQTAKGWDRLAKRAFAKPVAAMSVGERERAYRRDAGRWEPLALFVGEGGGMISGNLVNRIFETANRRIWSRRADPGAIEMPPKVTPHWMRHTFGMHLMWTLMHDLIERDDRLARLLREHDEPGIRAYGQSVMWPVQVVQELMRHRSLKTTWLYLYHLGELDHSVISSVDDLAEVFLALGQQVGNPRVGNGAR
jgi:integrase